MGDALEYPDVLQEVRGCMTPGRLKLQSSNVTFKNIKTGIVDQYQTADIEKVQWLIRARGHCLKVVTGSSVYRYDGFKESEFDKLSTFFNKTCDLEIVKKDLSVKGWNWGTAKFVGNALELEVGNNLAFDVPLYNVSQSRIGKNEVTMEFHPNDDAAVSLMEMRFHIPPDTTSPDADPVTEFHEKILGKADIIQATGDALAIFEEIQCLTPRGRYDIKIFGTFIQLHGKTFDYKIPHKTILRLFLLPHKDGRQMFFVVSLDPPLKQGQTRYPFLILLFQKEEEMTLELAIPEDELEEKYEGKLTKEMSGPSYEIISRVMKALLTRKITVPGSFMGHSGTQAVVCSFKASSGYLYPLEKGFMFVHKPPIHIRFDEIGSVNFARSAGSSRSFDFEVETQAGTMYTFSSIEKDEYGKLYDFVSAKKLQVKNIGGSKKMGSVYAEDMGGSDDEDNHDAYLERMKREGKLRDEDDEDDDSSDVSFKPEGSGSDVAEEYDSNVATTTDEEEDEGSGGSSVDEEEKARRRTKKEEKAKEREKKREKRSQASPVKRERKEKKERKKKKGSKKDPNAPKRPMAAYFLWLNDHREQIKEENPGISVTEVSKKAGEMWREITADDKVKYEKLAVKAKEEYKVALAKYEANKVEAGDSDEEEGSPKGKKERKSSKKKSPTSSRSPKKESHAGAGSNYKSKEFISSSSGSDSSDSDKPVKKKAKKERKSKRGKGKASEEEELELPSEEEILSDPPSSGKGSKASSESEAESSD